MSFLLFTIQYKIRLKSVGNQIHGVGFDIQLLKTQSTIVEMF